MNITISVVLFYREDLLKQFFVGLAQELDNFSQTNTQHDITLVVSDNSFDHQLPSQFFEILEGIKKIPQIKVEFIANNYNKGFGKANNEVFAKFPSDIFIALNYDIDFKESGWLMKLILPILNDQADVVGLDNGPKFLKDNGNGAFEPQEKVEFDYADGSILTVRSSLIKNGELFANDLVVAYFEDSDLSLRLRRMGARFSFVNIKHEHWRNSCTNVIPTGITESILERNRSRFLSRWSQYLERRTFTKRIFLDLTSDGWGDVICSLPAVLQAVKVYAGCEIIVLIKQKALYCFFEKIPNITIKVVPECLTDLEIEQERKRSDVSFFLRKSNFNSFLYLGREICQRTGVNFNAEDVYYYLMALTDEIEIRSLDLSNIGDFAIIHAEYMRDNWEGRGVDFGNFLPILNKLIAEGVTPIIVGAKAEYAGEKNEKIIDLRGKTSLLELAALISKATMFIGIDSGPLHFAQLLGKKTYAVFGATLPTSRILHWDHTSVFMNWDLDCLGCYHRSFISSNFCIRRDQACVKSLDSAKLYEDFCVFMEKNYSNLPKAVDLMQKNMTIMAEVERHYVGVNYEKMRTTEKVLNSLPYRMFNLMIKILKDMRFPVIIWRRFSKRK